MDEFWKSVSEVAVKVVQEVIISYQHNWLPLAAAILVAALMQALVNPETLKRAMSKKSGWAIIGAVVVGAFTPLCACGTTAVMVGMLTASVPWGPVMAFLTSSPLMSPDGFILLAGVISLHFAIGMTVASLIIGLGSGYITLFVEKKTRFLENQTRFQQSPAPAAGCGCGAGPSAPKVVAPAAECGCGDPTTATAPNPTKWQLFLKALVDLGLKQILPFFTLFIAIGALINLLVPTSLIAGLLGVKNVTSVPLAALIGLPLYVTGDSAIPLIKSLLDGGASGGAMMAFMITGSATSAWVVAGLASFMRRRVLGLYLGLILGGGILCGYLYDLAVVLGF